jgi:CHAD domain-containing protein
MLLDYIKLKDSKQALAGYISEAQSLLKQYAVPDDDAVHDIRVLMKKSRAVISLLRSQMDEESYTREYQALREVGRLMSSWRETSVHRKVLKSLRKSHPLVFSELKDFEPLNELINNNYTGPGLVEEIETTSQQIQSLLSKSGYRIRFLSLSNLDPKILLAELEKTYLSVSESYLACRVNPKPIKIHEFRKKAKNFLYQLWFFRPLKPRVIKSLEKRIDVMTQNLGKYNDLSVLIDTMGYKYSAAGNSPALDELIILIRDQQDFYLSKVWPQAYKIFCPGQKLVNQLGFKLLVF